MIITERDREVLNLIEKLDFLTTRNIADGFFNKGANNYYIVALRRMNKLVEYNRIKSGQAYMGEHGRPMTIFYFKKPSKRNLKHDITLNNFVIELLRNGCKIVSIQKEYWFKDKIRADALIKIEYKGRKRLFVVEVDITKEFDISKYEMMKRTELWKDCGFNKFPRIVSINDNNPKKSMLVQPIYLATDLNNVSNLFSIL